MDELLHVMTPEAWNAAQRDGAYPRPDAGFLHLCTRVQLPFVLGRHFAGRTGLLVLRIDPAGLDIRWERSEPGMDPFPHLYAPLPAAAVRGTEHA